MVRHFETPYAQRSLVLNLSSILLPIRTLQESLKITTASSVVSKWFQLLRRSDGVKSHSVNLTPQDESLLWAVSVQRTCGMPRSTVPPPAIIDTMLALVDASIAQPSQAPPAHCGAASALVGASVA